MISRHAESWAGSRTSSINDPDGVYFSTELGFPQRKKKNQKERKARKERPVETAAAMEIDKGGLRRLLLDDFHKLLEKAYARTASAFSQLRTGPTAVNLSTHFHEAAVHLKHAVIWS